MKKLFLLRHAQTLPADSRGDKERKLTPAGQADARALGQAMSRKHYRPEEVYCSPAVRTVQTLEGLMETLGSLSTLYLPQIYDGGQEELMEAIQGTAGTVGSLLVIAHNPSVHALAVALAQDNSPALMNRLSAGYRPGSMAVLGCDVETWGDIRPGRSMLLDFMEPQDYNPPSSPAYRA